MNVYGESLVLTFYKIRQSLKKHVLNSCKEDKIERMLSVRGYSFIFFIFPIPKQNSNYAVNK